MVLILKLGPSPFVKLAIRRVHNGDSIVSDLDAVSEFVEADRRKAGTLSFGFL
jgi:hypothetical protein